jgi:hypothetical protein
MQVFKRLKNHFNIILKSQPWSLQSCHTHEAHPKALYIIPFIQWEKKTKPELGWDVMPCSLTNKYQQPTIPKKETMPPPSVQKNEGGSEFFQTFGRNLPN